MSVLSFMVEPLLNAAPNVTLILNQAPETGAQIVIATPNVKIKYMASFAFIAA